jgi:phytoene synthase
MKKLDFGKIDNMSLESTYSYCENIAKQKNPFLYYVSSFFKDKNKFKAFCSTYASMRILDDFIDDINNRNSLTSNEKMFYLSEIDRWETLIIDCHNGYKFDNPILLALSDTFQNFNFHLTPWIELARSMRCDVEKSRFKTFEEFLKYAEGAAVAPATVCMYVLIAANNGIKYDCEMKDLDPYYYAKDLAIFCYLTHILRDISCDLELGEKGLIYISQDDMKKFSISANDFWRFKKNKTINRNFKELMKFQTQRAKEYGEKGEMLMKELFYMLDVDCRFKLNLLVSLYKKTMEKIEKVEYNVFNGEHELSSSEILNTTFHYSKFHSFGSLRTLRLGLSLLKKNVLK